MGCGLTKEKIEDEMMKAKLDRIQVQFERQKQLELLKNIDGTDYKSPAIPDYIIPKLKKIQSAFRTKRSSKSTNKYNNKSKTIKLGPKRNKSLIIKNKSLLNSLNTNYQLREKNEKFIKRKTVKI